MGSAEEKKDIYKVKATHFVMNVPASLIEYLADRPGSYFKYSLNITKIR